MRASIAPLVLPFFACGGDGAYVPRDPTPRITVVFEYLASTVVEPEIFEQHPACAELVGVTHLHPSWRQFDVVPLRAEGPELWTVTFDDVPRGFNRIRVSDRNVCALNETGAVTAHVIRANGALLTERVQTPGVGMEPGFGFAANADGSVTP